MRRTAFIADTAALILFFTTTGIINERVIAGMTWEQVLHARLLGAALMVPVAKALRHLAGLADAARRPRSGVSAALGQRGSGQFSGAYLCADYLPSAALREAGWCEALSAPR
ncbi:Protein of uncharacterised function (DUF1144) [Raoultella terrigena]|uniref:Protein of uncharacterized function (DUF1144) n=1 Tax=Raoultella terrigena TaxID=577 RepID=A0A4U9D2W4_RAOTE|nr:Protein of uncharacterised function (DUF1144) [Raoultella terrigena]